MLVGSHSLLEIHQSGHFIKHVKLLIAKYKITAFSKLYNIKSYKIKQVKKLVVETLPNTVGCMTPPFNIQFRESSSGWSSHVLPMCAWVPLHFLFYFPTSTLEAHIGNIRPMSYKTGLDLPPLRVLPSCHQHPLGKQNDSKGLIKGWMWN